MFFEMVTSFVSVLRRTRRLYIHYNPSLEPRYTPTPVRSSHLQLLFRFVHNGRRCASKKPYFLIIRGALPCSNSCGVIMFVTSILVLLYKYAASFTDSVQNRSFIPAFLSIARDMCISVRFIRSATPLDCEYRPSM